MKSVIIGAGMYGKVYLAYLKEAGIEVAGFLDDNKSLWNTCVENTPVLGGVDELRNINKTHGIEAVYCPIGSNEVRVRILTLARDLGYKTPCYIHPSLSISPNVSIAPEGVYILGGTNIMPHVTIEKDVMISIGANICHDTYLSQGTFISNGVNIGGDTHTEPCAYIGMGATIMTGAKRLGRGCLIGAGAVVIREVEDNAVMAGVPAKVIKYK